MTELVTVESMVELRKKLGVLPTLMDVRISPNMITVMCRDALGNLPEDLRDTVSQEFILSLSARGDMGGVSPAGATALSGMMKFMDAMRYKQAEVISWGYGINDSLYGVVAPYGKSWISPKKSYFTLRSLHSILNLVVWRDPKVREFVSGVTRAFTLVAVISGPGEVVPNGYVLKSLAVYRKAVKWLRLAKDNRRLRDNIDEWGSLIDALTLLKDEIMEGLLPIE